MHVKTHFLLFSALLFCCCSNSNYWCLYWYSPSLHFLFLLLCVASASEVAAAVDAAPHRPVTAVQRSAVACMASHGGVLWWRARLARLACTAFQCGVCGVQRHQQRRRRLLFQRARESCRLWTTTMQPSSAALFACLPLPITMGWNNFWRWAFLFFFYSYKFK